jgi:hypothetical protein
MINEVLLKNKIIGGILFIEFYNQKIKPLDLIQW